MQAPHSLMAAPLAQRTRRFLEIGWLIIVAKCLAVPWVISHWQVPVHPGWVIVPTLVFAVVVTLVVMFLREE